MDDLSVDELTVIIKYIGEVKVVALAEGEVVPMMAVRDKAKAALKSKLD